MEAILTHHGPKKWSTLRLFQTTTMWDPHEKKSGAASRALSVAVACQNSLSFGPKSTMILSHVVGALQSPGHL